MCLLSFILLDLGLRLFIRLQSLETDVFGLTAGASEIVLKQGVFNTIVAIRLPTTRCLHWIYKQALVDRAFQASILQLLVTNLNFLLSRLGSLDLFQMFSPCLFVCLSKDIFSFSIHHQILSLSIIKLVDI